MIGRVRTDALEAERSKGVALIIGVVGIVFFLSGCGSQAGEVPSDHPAGQERTATNEELPISKPPESTLSFGEGIVIGELGSYCRSRGHPPHEAQRGKLGAGDGGY